MADKKWVVLPDSGEELVDWLKNWLSPLLGGLNAEMPEAGRPELLRFVRDELRGALAKVDAELARLEGVDRGRNA